MRKTTPLLLVFVSLGVVVACSSSDDDGTGSPTPAPTTSSTNTTPPTGNDAGSSSGSTDATTPATDGMANDPAGDVCITSKTCASHQCQPDNKGDDQPRGTCVTNGTCIFIPPDGKAPKVDDHCVGVEPCLGFQCISTGIVAGPTGIFACNLAGDACTDEAGHRCCGVACDNGKCPGHP